MAFICIKFKRKYSWNIIFFRSIIDKFSKVDKKYNNPICLINKHEGRKQKNTNHQLRCITR
jgi:hypothetical protein